MHRTLAMMAVNRRNRGGKDARQGGAQRQVHHYFAVYALGDKKAAEHRYDNQPATHAQQTGQQADKGAEQQIRGRVDQHCSVVPWISCWRGSCRMRARGLASHCHAGCGCYCGHHGIGVGAVCRLYAGHSGRHNARSVLWVWASAAARH